MSISTLPNPKNQSANDAVIENALSILNFVF